MYTRSQFFPPWRTLDRGTPPYGGPYKRSRRIMIPAPASPHSPLHPPHTPHQRSGRITSYKLHELPDRRHTPGHMCNPYDSQSTGKGRKQRRLPQTPSHTEVQTFRHSLCHARVAPPLRMSTLPNRSRCLYRTTPRPSITSPTRSLGPALFQRPTI